MENPPEDFSAAMINENEEILDNVSNHILNAEEFTAGRS
jgi:hypothetical protein